MTVSPRIEQLLEVVFRSTYTSIVRVAGDSTELNAIATIWHEIPATRSPILQESGVSLDEVRLSFTPGDRLTLDVGRFRHVGGRALVVSPNNYYAAPSFDQLLRGDLGSVGSPQMLIVGRLFIGAAYATVVVMPAPAVPQLVPPGSIWIPSFPLDRTIDDPDLSDEPVTLSEVFAEYTSPINEPLRRVSGGLEVGTTVGSVDLALVYYHGIDPFPVPRARISFPSVPPRVYDLSLAPEEVVVDSIGLLVDTASQTATFWLDGAYTPRRTVTTTEVDRFAKRTKLLQVPAVIAVLGASYRVDQHRVLLLAEYHHEHLFLPEDLPSESVVRRPLGSDLILSGQASVGTRTVWTFGLSGALAVADRSALMLLSVLAESWSGLSASLGVPLFVGHPESDYGQYRDILHGIVGLRYRF